MELVFVRHGESEANVLEREVGGFLCGRWECELSPRGREQAKRLKGHPALSGASAVFSSPLKRAVDTAAAFADQPVVTDARIAERTMGDFDGQWIHALAEQDAYRRYFTEEHWKHFRDSFTVSAPNGEHYGDVVQRVTPFLEELKLRQLDKVIIVSHAVAIRCMLKVVLGLTEEETLHFPVWQCDPISAVY